MISPDDYTYESYRGDEDGERTASGKFYWARCIETDDIAHGESINEAISVCQEKVAFRLEHYAENGLAMPEPRRQTEQYSGKFVVRMRPGLHRSLAEEAEEQHVSLNHLLNSILEGRSAFYSYKFQAASILQSISRPAHWTVDFRTNQTSPDRLLLSLSSIFGEQERGLVPIGSSTRQFELQPNG